MNIIQIFLLVLVLTTFTFGPTVLAMLISLNLFIIKKIIFKLLDWLFNIGRKVRSRCWKKKIIGLHNSIYTNKTNINGNKTLNDGFFFSVKNFYLNKKGNFNSIKDGRGGGLKGVGGGCSGCCSKRPLLAVFPLFSSVCILYQSQIIELESRPPLKNAVFLVKFF